MTQRHAIQTTAARFALSVALVLATVSTANAAGTIQLDLAADNGSRWYDYFSDAFGELGLLHQTSGSPTPPIPTESVPGTNDGFFQITNPTTQFGAANVFVNDNDFSSSYSLIYDDSTALNGVGVEVRSVTGFTLDFDSDIADADFISNTGYTTTSTNVAGTVTFTDGVLTSIDTTSDITFDLGPNPFNPSVNVAYSGSFDIVGNNWSLLVNVPLDGQGEFDLAAAQPKIGSFDFEVGWDVTGTVTNVIPEPASASLILLAGVSGLAVRCRPRR